MGIKGGYHLQLGQGLDETGRESSVVPGPQLSAQHKVIAMLNNLNIEKTKLHIKWKSGK